jgi:hypothetical protein
VREEHDTMSVEQQPRRTTDDPEQYQIPTHAPEHESRTDKLRDGNWLVDHWKQITAVGVAGTALAVGLALGLKGNSEVGASPVEGKSPVATAPANPSETTPAAPETFAPNPEAGSWTAENVPLTFTVNGKTETYNGVAAAAEALALKESDYPTPEAYEKAKFELINQWMNWGNNPAAEKQYAGYLSLDSNSVLGPEAIANDFVDQAFKEALTSDTKEGVPIQGDGATLNEAWANDMSALRQSIRTLYEFSINEGKGGEPYKFAFTVDSTEFTQGATTAAPYGGTTKLSYGDNFEKTGIAKAQEVIGSPYSKKSGTTEWGSSVQVQDGKWQTVGTQYQPIS